MRVFCLLCFFFVSAGLAYGQEKMKVTVSIAPLAYFTERIGKDKVDVTVMIPPGANPHVYEPTPGQLRQLSESRMYVKVGSGIEFELTWMGKLAALNREMLICDASREIGLIEQPRHHESGHEEIGQDKNGPREFDPHIWTSPANAITMCFNIRNCLIEADPANAQFYHDNFQELAVSLRELTGKITQDLQGAPDKFFIYHPALGYYAREFGLKEIAAEQSGKEPSPRQLADLIRQAREQGIKTVFVTPQFSKKSAQVIAREIDGRVETVDPLAYDYPETMMEITRALNAKQDGK